MEQSVNSIEKSSSSGKQQELSIQDKQIWEINKQKEHNIYDFVKIKVLLDEHYYVFSRYLICRVLTLCRIKKLDAAKIAKDIKKKLVEEGKYEIQQSEMEKLLFDQIRINGYTDHFIERYQMTSLFYRKRTPLIILLSGTRRLGKSNIANYLAERMNISNVLQTNIVEQVMKIIDLNYFKELINFDEQMTDEELINKYVNISRTIRKGVHTDIQKALSEGKPVIIEGFEIEPILYVKNLNQEKQQSNEDNCKMDLLIQYIDNEIELKKKCKHLQKYNISNHKEDKFQIIQPDADANEGQAEIVRIKKIQQELQQTESNAALVVPILLILNKGDHIYNIENLSHYQSIQNQDERKKLVELRMNNYQKIQRHLLKQAKLCTVVPVNVHNLEETIDTLHDIIVEKIEASFKRNEF